MTPRTPIRLLVLAGALLGCRHRTPEASPTPDAPAAPPAPTAAERWTSARTQVESLLTEGRVAGADSVLVAYTRAVAPADAAPALRWRVLLRLDPRASNGDLAPTIALLDSLLADTTAPRGLRPEGTLLRRGLAAADSLRRLEGRRRVQATQQATERADELRTTRDSLAKLAAEIERLKRRLRAP